MADNIKGINVVIGADTTQLSAALTDVNKKSKSLQTELKDVERLLKFDPGNADLVAQKQQVLTDSITNTSEKLNRLRSVQEQVNRQFANGDISPEQFRAFNREVTRTEQQLQSLTNNMNALNANRITVTINGDTKPVSQALEDINKRSRDLQNELRQVDQLLRLDPGNLELVAQKQRLLTEQIENTSNKLNVLRSTQQQVNEQFARGDISEEQFKAFNREVTRTEQQLNNLRTQLQQVGSEQIRITINGNTTSVTQALEDVSTKGKRLQNELKEIDRLLELDPTNVNLVAQKQQILTEAVSNSTEQLNRLRGMQQQVNEQFARGDIGAEQFRQFQREVTRAEQEVNDLQGQLQRVGSEQIRITINGNSTSVTQALEDVSDKGKRLQNELKEVDRLLQLDPSNVNLVAQRQQVLTEAVSNSTEKLNRLRGMQEQVNQQFARGDIGPEQYREFQREVARAEQDVQDLTNRLNHQEEEVSELGRQYRRAFDDARQSMDNMFDSLKRVGVVAATAGVAIAAGLGIAVKKAADFEQAMSYVKAVMAPDEVKEFGKALEDLALKMGAETKYSATEAAEGIEELVKAGVSTKDILNGGLSGALSLATAGSLELADAAEVASTALNSFKDDNLSVQNAADLLAGAANASATSVSEMKYSLSAVAAVASGMGLSFKDTTTAIAVFAQNGLKGSDAGTSLKTMLMNLQPSTKAQIKEFERLGLMTYSVQKGMQVLKDNGIKPAGSSFKVVDAQLQKLGATLSGSKEGSAKARDAYQELTMQTGIMQSAFYDAEGSMRPMDEIAGILKKTLTGMTDAQRAASLEIMFGSDAIRAGNILYKEGAKGVDTMATAMGKVGANDVAATKLDNLKGQIEQLNGAIETLLISLGNALLPAVKKIATGFQGMVDALNGLTPQMQSFIAISAVIAAAVGIIGGALLVVIGFIPSIAAGFALLTTSILPSLGTALLAITGPVGIAVAALIAATIIVIKYWEPISEFFKNLWSTVSEFTISAWEGIKQFFANLVPSIQSAWEATPGFFSGLWDGITSTLTDAWQGVLDFFAGLWEKIKGFFTSGPGEVVAMSSPMIGLPLLIFNHWDELVGWLQGVWDTISEAASIAWKIVVNYIIGIITPFIPIIIEQFNNIKNGISQVWEGLKNYFVGAWEVLKTIFLGALLILVDLVTGDFGKLKEDIAKIWDNIKAGFSKSWSGIQQVFTTAMQLIQSLVKTGFELMSKIIGTVFETIKKLATDGWNGLKTVTVSVVTAIGEAIKTGFQASAQFIASIFTTIKNTAVSAWNGLKSAISTAVTATGEAIKTAFNAVLNFFKTLPATLRTLGVNMFVSMKNGIVATIKTIQSATKTGIDAAFKFLKELPNDAIQWGKDIIQGLINGIKNKIAEVKNVVGEVAETIKAKIRGALSIKSPSRVTMKYGENVSEGLAIGIKNKSKDVANASNDVAKTVDSSFSKSMDKIVKNAANAAAGSKTSADKIKKSFAEAFSTAQSEKKLGHLDTSEYIQALQQIQSQYAKTSDQSRKVTQEIAAQHKSLSKEQVEAAKKSYDETKAFIDKRSENGTLSLVKELDMWEKVQGRYKEGSEQRKAAEEELGNTRVQIYEKLSTASENFLAKTKEVNDNVAAEELRLNKAYEDAVTQRAASINDFAGLFDAVTDKSETTGQELLENLKGQVEYLGTWSEQIAQLATKGIDEGLLAELRELGPKALPQLLALNQLTTEQLSQYSSLWLEKSAESREIAVGEFTGLREDTNAQIVKLHTDAAKEMNGLKKEFLASVKEISSGSKKEFDAMNASLSQIGKQSMQGLLNGLKSMKGEVVAQAKDIANAVSKTMQKALDIHSPSREMTWIGEMAGQGLVNGMASMVSSVKSQASHLATAAMPLINQTQTDVASASSTSSINAAPMVFNMEGLFAGAHFNVRSDNDIQAIAKELFNLTQQASRGMGGAR